MAPLQTNLDQLTCKRDALAEFADLHLALLFPAPKVTHDILREIFIASLPSDRHPTMHCGESPLVIFRSALDLQHITSRASLWTHQCQLDNIKWLRILPMRQNLVLHQPRSCLANNGSPISCKWFPFSPRDQRQSPRDHCPAHHLPRCRRGKRNIHPAHP
ncbi:hypothetical protein MVEN_00800300 [Mycena venus]|uniref:Uncharacterized protein n=1 Tax=Mycena venus TaxID=2733690 RepID=A0A8H7D419_9AGAR|nr:hypothetical protein MVEN_00800300 [Mycena venus]